MEYFINYFKNIFESIKYIKVYILYNKKIGSIH